MDRARIEEEFKSMFGPIRVSLDLNQVTGLSAIEFAAHIASLAISEAIEESIEEIANIYEKYGSLSLGVTIMRLNALKKELLQKALESITSLRTQVDAMNCEPTEELSIETEIKSVLAQPEEKPYGYALERHDGAVSFFRYKEEAENHFTSLEFYAKLALYLHPNSQTERKPLTARQIQDMTCEGVFLGSITEIVRAIESAHGIKE